MSGGSGAAGLAALLSARSVLLSLTDNGIIDEAEAKAILMDAATAHRGAVPLADGAAGEHEEAAVILEAIREGGNSVRHASRHAGRAAAISEGGGRTMSAMAVRWTPRSRLVILDFQMERHLVGAVRPFQQQKASVTVSQEAGSRRMRRVKVGIPRFRRGSRPSGMSSGIQGSRTKRPPVPRPTAAGRYLRSSGSRSPPLTHASPPEPASTTDNPSSN